MLLAFITNRGEIMNTNYRSFISPFQGRYNAGYVYFNGYRDVYVYIRTVYNERFTYVLDYTHAKTFTLATAKKHAAKIENEITIFNK